MITWDCLLIVIGVFGLVGAFLAVVHHYLREEEEPQSAPSGLSRLTLFARKKREEKQRERGGDSELLKIVARASRPGARATDKRLVVVKEMTTFNSEAELGKRRI